MLDRGICLKELHRLKSMILPVWKNDKNLFQEAWSAIAADQAFFDWVKKFPSEVRHPVWTDRLDSLTAVISYPTDYTVLAVDGSQIYPDRHNTASPFFLINAGGCILSYKKGGSAEFFNTPELFLVDNFMPEYPQIPFTADVVDAKREEVELFTAYTKAVSHKDAIVLFDGSLIFWHLESKTEEVRELFLGKYLDLLLSFFNQKILVAGYISMPKSKELVNLVRMRLCLATDKKPCFGAIESCPCVGPDTLVDALLLEGILAPYQRTIVFINRAKISEFYPPKLRPCFFYMHTGKEIARIEIPYWIASDEVLLDKIAQICLNQAIKGDGYPVVLAEAHEQAVIKNNDRMFFYQLLEQLSIQEKTSFLYSQKSIKKRGLRI